ncbi:hypothetical protein ILYODFUR_009073 [Ilyodon furcidens]|uniref:Secreted protein n=1 Tax=Ilyodon furcidens TaxID=33524 RepID=A0ABV0UHN7_9TELE
MMLIKHTWLLILHVRVSIKAGLFDIVLLQSTQVCVNQIPRWKDISTDFREAAVFAHQPGRGDKTNYTQSEGQHSAEKTIIHKWKTFKRPLFPYPPKYFWMKMFDV